MGQKPAIELAREVDELGALLQQTNPLTSYLGKAEALLDASHPWQDAVRTARADLMAKIASPKQRSESDFKRLLAQTLGDLKTKYQDAYLAAHERARLGANDDKRKASLAKDSRLAQLQKIAGVDMMPTPQLRDFENKTVCAEDLFPARASRLGKRSALPALRLPAGGGARGRARPRRRLLLTWTRLLDALVRGWTETLRSNLEDPTVSGNIDLVSDAAGKRRASGLSQEQAASRSREPGLREGASGSAERSAEGGDSADAELQAALSEGGLPCTVGDLRERFDRYVANLTKGKDVARSDW